MIVIRETTAEDIDNIYNNLNLTYVKKYCKNNEDEQKNNHKRWYSFLINSPFYTMFTVESLEGDFLGVVKFELEEDFEGAEISLYLTENIRGKGYSNTIIDASTEEIKFKHPTLKYVVAYILEENLRSITCFERSEFIFQGQIEHRDVEYQLYMKMLS